MCMAHEHTSSSVSECSRCLARSSLRRLLSSNCRPELPGASRLLLLDFRLLPTCMTAASTNLTVSKPHCHFELRFQAHVLWRILPTCAVTFQITADMHHCVNSLSRPATNNRSRLNGINAYHGKPSSPERGFKWAQANSSMHQQMEQSD